MNPALHLQPGQQELTPAQEAEARRFVDEYIRRQLSTEPVDEQKARRLLRQAYQMAGLALPPRIQWLDGPLQLYAVLAHPTFRASVRNSLTDSVGDNLSAIRASLSASVGDGVGASVRGRAERGVWDSVGVRLWESVWASTGDSLWGSVRANATDASVRAYVDGPWLAFYHFLAVYLAPNDLQALMRFNELVSGYWLGNEAALLVRRPKVLSRDAAGRLHSATSKAIAYHDGWGFYAWHGVRVSEQVILAPERLSRRDFLSEPNVEVRRIIQERMGSRFLSELGGYVIESGPCGTLYQVKLPADDPEGVARYVQVQDASTARQYFLRVPPTIQTAAEAVAWSFGLSGEDYHPAQET